MAIAIVAKIYRQRVYMKAFLSLPCLWTVYFIEFLPRQIGPEKYRRWPRPKREFRHSHDYVKSGPTMEVYVLTSRIFFLLLDVSWIIRLWSHVYVHKILVKYKYFITNGTWDGKSWSWLHHRMGERNKLCSHVRSKPNQYRLMDGRDLALSTKREG